VFEQSPIEPASARDLAGWTVLVIEDNYLIAGEICAALEASGARVIGPAPDVEQGRALLDRQPLDCAVLDVNLLGEPVYSLANELRARGIAAIFATGYDAEFLSGTFRDSLYLQKPIDLTALIDAVKSCAESHSGRHNQQQARAPG
jgi:DNA-binding response OmpR family regulator